MTHANEPKPNNPSAVYGPDENAARPQAKAGAETRDQRGRWKKGRSGNPKGRPRRQSVDESDEYVFSNALVKVRTPEGTKMVSRRQAVLLGLFAGAAKGDKRLLMYLYKMFKDAEARRAEAYVQLEALERERIALMVAGKPVPAELETMIASARRYFGME